ncbi:MAG TPA: hypothetical protein VHW47_06395, partial [Acidimicrobiales bacterium]|nr:hypothetical protein [Acidimicrobiales bacterium]
ERVLRHDPPLSGECEEAEKVIAAELDRAVTEVPELGHLHPVRRLIGLAGTVSTLALLDQGLDRYTRTAVHHAVLSLDRVGHWCEVLGGQSSEARGRLPGMEPGRRDVIFGGALILQAVMARLDVGECLVSEADILDGLAASLLGQSA